MLEREVFTQAEQHLFSNPIVFTFDEIRKYLRKEVKIGKKSIDLLVNQHQIPLDEAPYIADVF